MHPGLAVGAMDIPADAPYMKFSLATSAETTAAPVGRGPSRRIPRGILLLAFVAAGGLVTLVLQGLGVWGGSARTEYILNDWLTVALQVVAVGVIAARALTTRRDRWIWMTLTAAAMCYTAGQLAWSILYAQLEEPPFPSIADPFWLAFYPFMLFAFAGLIRNRIRSRRSGALIDGLIGAFAVSTVYAAVVLDAVLSTLEGGRLGIATNLAYPIGDLLILACVVAYLSLAQWRLSPRWMLLILGSATLAVSDGVYVYAVALDQVAVGAFVNFGFSAAMLMIAFSTWLRDDDVAPAQCRDEMRGVLPSMGIAIAAIVTLVADHYIRLGGATVWLASATLAVALIRTGLSFRENLMLLDARELSLRDELTGLANRRMLLRHLSDTIDQARPAGRSVALLLIDLDRFKDVNDALGHHVGDELLRVVALRLTETLRGDALVARLGGDEFCIVVSESQGAVSGRIVAQRLLDALSRPVVLDGMNIDVGASIGVSLFPDHGDSASELLRSSDIAMYQAKANGGGEHALYAPDPLTDDVRRLGLVGDFRGALDRGEIEVYYQPRFDAVSGLLTSVEALVRWRHPELGLLLPGAFLPGIERSTLIVPLTEHVLCTALRDTARWRVSRPDLTVAVNLSARLLHSLDLATMVRDALVESGVPPQHLELEVTETMVMANPERAAELLAELDGMGVRIAVDDFGVGQASLAYLTDLPVSILKIDRSFVNRMDHSDRHSAVVAAILDLSERLGMVSVAEGVEEEDTLQRLTALGCDEIQGYLLARPMPAGEIDGLITGAPWGNREETAPAHHHLPA